MEKDKSKKKVATGDQGMELLKWEEFCNRVNNQGENPHKVLREMGLDKEFLKDIPLAEGYSPTAEVQGMPLMETTGEIAVPLASPDGGITFRRARRQRQLNNPQNTIRPIRESDSLDYISQADPRRPSRNPIRRSPGTLNLEAMEGDSDSEEADRNQIIRSVDSEPEAFTEMRNRLDESPTQGLFNRRIGGGNRKHKKTKTKRKSKKTRRKKRSKKRKTIKKIRKKKKNNTRKKKGGSGEELHPDTRDIIIEMSRSPIPPLDSQSAYDRTSKKLFLYNLLMLIDSILPGNVLKRPPGQLTLTPQFKQLVYQQIASLHPDSVDKRISNLQNLLRDHPQLPDLPEGYEALPLEQKFEIIKGFREQTGGSDDDTDPEVVRMLSSPGPSLSKRDEKELNKKRALVYNLYLLIDTHSPDTYISVISPYRGNLSSARGNLSISSEDGKLKKELIKQINKFSPETLDSAINEIETILRHNPSYPDLPEGYDMLPTREKFMAIREMRTNKAEDKA